MIRLTVEETNLLSILKVFQPPQHVGTLHTVGLDDLELLFTRNRFRLLCNNFLRGGGKMGKRLQ